MAVTMTMVSLVVLPHGTWGDWMNSVPPTGGYGKIPFHLFSPAMPWNQGINGFTARLFLHPDSSLTVNAAAARWGADGAGGRGHCSGGPPVRGTPFGRGQHYRGAGGRHPGLATEIFSKSRALEP